VNPVEFKKIQGLKISQITLGTVQLGLDYGIANSTGKPSFENALEILSLATECGINVFDTAPAYGNSENIIGSYISSLPPKTRRPIVVTKIPEIKCDEDSTSESIYEEMESSVLRSIDNLHLESIPICLLHNAANLTLYNGKVIESLAKLKENGLVDKIGVSIYSPDDVRAFLQYDYLDVIQVPFNIFDQRLIREELLQELNKRNTIIFARSIFLQGLFFIDHKSVPPHLKKARKFLQDLRTLSEESGIEINRLAFSYARDRPEITSLVLGVETIEQLRDNLSLLNYPPLSSDVTSKIEECFANVPEEIVNPSKWLNES